MATAKLKLRSSPNKDGLHVIIIQIYQKQTNTAIPTRYAVQKKHFKNERIMKSSIDVGSVREANLKLSRKLNEVWDYIEELEDKRIIERMTAVDIAKYIKNGGEKRMQDDFNSYLDKFIATKKNKSTKEKYQSTANYLKRNYDKLFFEDITKSWLYKFKNKRLEQFSPSTVNIDLRNIRAVFNHAIFVDETIPIKSYPFRKFEFAKTTPRNLRRSLDEIKGIRDFETDNILEQRAIDFFMLSFYLIGANTSDIYNLKEIKDGRIEYYRNKTSKFYSIKLEPEALLLFKKHKGEKELLFFQENYASVNSLTQRINDKLRIIGQSIGISNLTMYHARHSWAGLAAKHPIGAGKDLIAQALGHGKTTVTDTYFDYDTKLVDDLNRRVLDLLK